MPSEGFENDNGAGVNFQTGQPIIAYLAPVGLSSGFGMPQRLFRLLTELIVYKQVDLEVTEDSLLDSVLDSVLASVLASVLVSVAASVGDSAALVDLEVTEGQGRSKPCQLN